VSSGKTKGLLESFLRTCHEEGNQQHTAGQILAANAEEEESHHAIGGILHMQIGEGKKERTHEQASAKDEACEELFEQSISTAIVARWKTKLYKRRTSR
jgi:hypothetical protein